MAYRTPSNISAASSMANINIYDNPTLNTSQAISRSRQGSKVKEKKVIQNHDEIKTIFLPHEIDVTLSKVWDRHSSMRDSRRLHHQQIQLAERLSNTATLYDMDLGATAATMAAAQQVHKKLV